MTTTTRENPGNSVDTNDAAMSFEEMLDQYEYTLPERGQILQGEIIRVAEDAIIMNVGAKRDAIVPHTDLNLLDQEVLDSLKAGYELPVYVLRTPVGDDELLVSINKGLEQQDWTRADELLETEEAVELDICGYNKGGLLVQFGQLEGFVPNSHVPDLRYGSANAELESAKARRVGETLLVKVLEVDQERRRLIFSAKAAHQEHRRRMLEMLEVGAKIPGRVANIVNYGAFVDIGAGVSGLLHVSEIAWHRVEHPSRVLAVGDEIEVEIQEVDVDRERVSLSRKAVMPNPWDSIEQRHNIGDLITGRVTNIEDFGAFVEVQKGVVGLVHVSEIDISSPSTIQDVLHAGDQVLVRIIDIDPDEERLSLSLRRVSSEEQIAWMREHASVGGEAEVAAAEEPAAELSAEAFAESELPTDADAQAQEQSTDDEPQQPEEGQITELEPAAASEAAPEQSGTSELAQETGVDVAEA